MEKKSPPGFERSYIYTGEEKGGLDPPRRKSAYFIDLLPLLYYLFSLKEHINIPHTPSLNSNKPSMTAPKQHKQRYYYIFWSIATVAVVIGQIYVASSYRALAEALRMNLL